MEQPRIPGRQLCEQLRQIAEAELVALEEGDLGKFLLLAGERTAFQRDVLQPALDHLPSRSAPREVVEILREVSGIDRTMSAHLTRMARETSQEIQALRRGRSMLQAYGHPGVTLMEWRRLVDQSR